jgi:hypothetical protein
MIDEHSPPQRTDIADRRSAIGNHVAVSVVKPF